MKNKTFSIDLIHREASRLEKEAKSKNKKLSHNKALDEAAQLYTFENYQEAIRFVHSHLFNSENTKQLVVQTRPTDWVAWVKQPAPNVGQLGCNPGELVAAAYDSKHPEQRIPFLQNEIRTFCKDEFHKALVIVRDPNHLRYFTILRDVAAIVSEPNLEFAWNLATRTAKEWLDDEKMHVLIILDDIGVYDQTQNFALLSEELSIGDIPIAQASKINMQVLAKGESDRLAIQRLVGEKKSDRLTLLVTTTRFISNGIGQMKLAGGNAINKYFRKVDIITTIG